MRNGVKVIVAKSCPTSCVPNDYSLPDSSVHGLLQTRILEWVAVPSLRDITNIGIDSGLHIFGGLFTIRIRRECWWAGMIISQVVYVPCIS